MKNNNKSQRTIIYLAAVFLVPLLLAIIFFIGRDYLSIFKAASHGQLIHPAQPITEFELTTDQDDIHRVSILHGKWTYILYAPYPCNLECEAALFKIRQTRLSAGKDVNRVQYMMVFEKNNKNYTNQEIVNRHPQLLIAELNKWATEGLQNNQVKLEPGIVYLIDPLGNIMMQYNLETTSKGMLKDLKKLLRVSNIG